MTRNEDPYRFPGTDYAPYTFIVAALDYILRRYKFGVRHKCRRKRHVTTLLFHLPEIGPDETRFIHTVPSFTLTHDRDMLAEEAVVALEALAEFTKGSYRALRTEVLLYLHQRPWFTVQNALCRMVGEEYAKVILDFEYVENLEPDPELEDEDSSATEENPEPGPNTTPTLVPPSN